MGTEIPSFQVDIYDQYDHDSVAVLAFNYDSSVPWLSWYASVTGLGSPKDIDVPITYPFLFDSTGTTFDTYETPDDPEELPTIFLLDQNGLIHIRSDDLPDAEFDNFMDEIISTIDELLAYPPEP